MRRSLLDVLVDPLARTALELETTHDGDDVEEGLLHGAQGRIYPIRDGIPRIVLTEDDGQRQTGESFGYKWAQRDSWDTDALLEFGRRWLAERYGFGDMADVRRFFGEHERVLDAGCGSGFGAAKWLTPDWGHGESDWVGLDISSGVDEARRRLGAIGRTHLVQGDLVRPPFRPGSFGAVLADGVLHHTPSTAVAFAAMADLLEPGGELLAYVYRRKAPVREFADDYVRGLVADLPPEEAWEALRPLTRLARSLAELDVQVDVPEDVPLLGIQAGRYDVQRLVYWHFAKLFWNEELELEVNNHVNFDWYHPRYAHRHTEAELRAWCDEAGLEVARLDAQESGFSLRARRA